MKLTKAQRAEAKQMGLSAAQIKQAELEGVTTAIGFRRIEKNSRGSTSR
jgi:hypothetical protein